MIERYSPPRMREVWSDRRRFELWLQVEILAAEGWARQGRVPEDALPKIRTATFDVQRVHEVEEKVGHDVIAFLTVVGESIGQPEARYLHMGLTSSDIVDTALALQLREASALIVEDLQRARKSAAELAVKHRRTMMVGRTHGIHAEPMTFGLKVASWVAELDRAIVRIQAATKEVAVGKLSGVVGTHATIPPKVEEYVCQNLGLGVDPVSTQVVSRDRHAAFVSALAVAAASMERVALEIRHLQRTEVGEALEPFGADQKGSSAMPHKRNPVICERICGLARVVRGYATTQLENVALWHERDISHSSAERIVLPDACCLVDYIAQQLSMVLTGLEVRPDKMARNLDLGGGVIFSQRVLLALVDAGMSREDGYLIVQTAARRALEGGSSFRQLLGETPEVQKLLGDKLGTLFNAEQGLEHVDVAFDRIGLAAEVKT